MENKVTIDKKNILQAYNQATVEQKALLENLFGKDMFKPKDIRERVKTFEDACEELGENNALIQAYRTTAFNMSDISDVVAYLKLRIISAALNEGWEPQYTSQEGRWYPWFDLLTEDELENKSDEWKTDNKCLLVRCSSNCGLVYSFSSWSGSNAYYSACLAVKSEELAEYFGKQFIDIWSEYLFK